MNVVDTFTTIFFRITGVRRRRKLGRVFRLMPPLRYRHPYQTHMTAGQKGLRFMWCERSEHHHPRLGNKYILCLLLPIIFTGRVWSSDGFVKITYMIHMIHV